MAYLFKQINTLSSSAKSQKRETIYNLDHFHTIERTDNKIVARLDKDNVFQIAICKNAAGAEYIMQCILHNATIHSHELNKREREI